MPKIVLTVVVLTVRELPTDEAGTIIGLVAEPGVGLLGEGAQLLLDRHPSPIPVCAAGLSEREVQVLRLVARGRSNQQIAEELVISLHTVARHVSNIFGKTGAANRAEAAVYAFRQGLL